MINLTRFSNLYFVIAAAFTLLLVGCTGQGAGVAALPPVAPAVPAGAYDGSIFLDTELLTRGGGPMITIQHVELNENGIVTGAISTDNGSVLALKGKVDADGSLMATTTDDALTIKGLLAYVSNRGGAPFDYEGKISVTEKGIAKPITGSWVMYPSATNKVASKMRPGGNPSDDGATTPWEGAYAGNITFTGMPTGGSLYTIKVLTVTDKGIIDATIDSVRSVSNPIALKNSLHGNIGNPAIGNYNVAEPQMKYGHDMSGILKDGAEVGVYEYTGPGVGQWHWGTLHLHKVSN